MVNKERNFALAQPTYLNNYSDEDDSEAQED